jgi:hypothetical protein
MKTETSTVWPVPQKSLSVNESEMVKWLTSGSAASAAGAPHSPSAMTVPSNSVKQRIGLPPFAGPSTAPGSDEMAYAILRAQQG